MKTDGVMWQKAGSRRSPPLSASASSIGSTLLASRAGFALRGYGRDPTRQAIHHRPDHAAAHARVQRQRMDPLGESSRRFRIGVDGEIADGVEDLVARCLVRLGEMAADDSKQFAIIPHPECSAMS
jgi:hypothetical protein